MLTFSPRFNVGSFIWVHNFGLTFWNKLEKGDWSFVLRVDATTMIKHIDPFMLDLCFDVIHSIKKKSNKRSMAWTIPRETKTEGQRKAKRHTAHRAQNEGKN